MSRHSLKSPFPKTVYQRNASIYRILANPKRLEILNIIKRQEATVDELASLLELRKANVSQHLALLRTKKVVTARREGQNVYYKVTDPRIIEPCRIFKRLWETQAIG